MQHIQFRKRQRVNDCANRRQRLEVSRRVNHQTSVREARSVLDDEGCLAHNVDRIIEIEHDQLRKCFKRAQRAVDSGGMGEGKRTGAAAATTRWDGQSIRFIRFESADKNAILQAIKSQSENQTSK